MHESFVCKRRQQHGSWWAVKKQFSCIKNWCLLWETSAYISPLLHLFSNFNCIVSQNPLKRIPSIQHKDNIVHPPLSLLIKALQGLWYTEKKDYSISLMQPRSLWNLALRGGAWVMFLSGCACYMKTTAWILYILCQERVCFCFFWFNKNMGCGQKWGWFKYFTKKTSVFNYKVCMAW